jgi:hypothetical protein
MEVVKLPVGKQASVEADCIRLEEQPDHRWRLTATALCTASDEGQSASIIGGLVFATSDEAERAGLAWAEDVGVEHLFISTGTVSQPLETLEIDKPL